MARLPWKLTREWTTVVPEDNPMAIFINGKVTQSDEHEPVNSKRGALYRRRVLILRGRWKLAEMRGWDASAGDWIAREGASEPPSP